MSEQRGFRTKPVVCTVHTVRGALAYTQGRNPRTGNRELQLLEVE